MNKGIGLWRGELSGRGIMLRCRSRNELVSARVKAHLRPIIKKEGASEETPLQVRSFRLRGARRLFWLCRILTRSVVLTGNQDKATVAHERGLAR